MKIKFLAVGQEAPIYSLEDETVNGFDLSPLEYGDEFLGNEDTKAIGIRHAERDEHGELWVELCQQTGPGHWKGMDEYMNASEYDPDEVYVNYLGKPHSGTPWVKTAQGKVHSISKEVVNA